MKHKLVEIVKGEAHFVSFKLGILTYRITVYDKDDFTTYDFPIDTNNKDDIGEGSFLEKEKGILLMRWLKRAIDNEQLLARTMKYE